MWTMQKNYLHWSNIIKIKHKKKRNNICMKNKLIFTFVMVIASAIIGAGFASGKEIVTFFGKYGFWALPFLLLIFVLFSFIFYLFGVMGKIVKPKSISDMTKFIFKKFSFIMDILIVFAVFIVMSAMVAGSDQIGTTIWGSEYNFPYISIFTIIGVVVIVGGGLKSVFRASNYIMPVVLFIILFVLMDFFIASPKEVVTAVQPMSFVGGLEIIFYCMLYISLNTMSNSFLIAQTGNYMRLKQIKIASIIAGTIITVIVGVILLALLFSSNVIFQADMPMMQLALLSNNILASIYAIILWLAIITSVVVSGYLLTKWLEKFIKNDWLCISLIMLLSFTFSRFGFSNIVTIFYPIKGAIGLIYLVSFSIYYFTHKKQIKNMN